MVNVFIHALTYGGPCSELSAAVADTAVELERRGIQSIRMWSEMAGLAQARNIGAAIMLAHPECTHLMQVDRDMAFRATAVSRMLEADKDYIACIAKTKDGRYNFDRPLASTGQPIFPVERIGAAVSLCKRSVLDRLIASKRLRIQQGGTRAPVIYGFFDTIYLDNGEELIDDYAFCHRWREFCGGKVHALSDETIGHVSRHLITANFLAEQAHGSASRR